MLSALLHILDTPPSLLGEEPHDPAWTPSDLISYVSSTPLSQRSSKREISLGDPQTVGKTLPIVECFAYLVNDGSGYLTGKHIFLGSLQ